ncbi:2Fe-2S ferredoxin-type domain-containing protein [Tribonema minus]|uniref:2Fe-2S ferredoxin-type domain-containing protein n=1 Tax=Tribonema minus TaxID=303371 RepID=A0A835Z7P0_9STRA|nr:2Fe-2S ferredoxin-type domain-containing protein [Tribonema minus]
MRAAAAVAAAMLAGQASAFLMAPTLARNTATVRSAMPQELETELDPARTWEVELTLNGETKVVTIPEGTSVLEAAELVFDDPPNSCRNGVCSTCAGHIDGGANSVRYAVSGLGQDLLGEGYALTCQTYPAGPGVKVSLNKMDEVYMQQYGKHSEEEQERKMSGGKTKVFGMF